MNLDWPSVLVGAAISIITSLVIGFYVNLQTPLFRDWLNKRSLNLKGKSLQKLNEELLNTQNANKNSTKTFANAMNTLLFISFGSYSISFAILFAVIIPTVPNSKNILGWFLIVLLFLLYTVAYLGYRKSIKNLDRLGFSEENITALKQRIEELESQLPAKPNSKEP